MASWIKVEEQNKETWQILWLSCTTFLHVGRGPGGVFLSAEDPKRSAIWWLPSQIMLKTGTKDESDAK